LAEPKTKIVCTFGPASSDPEVIEGMIKAGMDVARLNFSHGSHKDHATMIKKIRKIARGLGKEIPILQDLQGPKIRVGQLRGGSLELLKGDKLILSPDPKANGVKKRISVSYNNLSRDLKVGGNILVDDGNIELIVTQVMEEDVETEVVVGGTLLPRKGVNLPRIKSQSSSLTDKDIEDLEFGLSQEVDLIALSFVRKAKDVKRLKKLIKKAGKDVPVFAKIEKPEAVEGLDAIIKVSDGIMVARGDLGIEMSLAKVPLTQKMIIRKCLQTATPVITATQMLDSMINSPRPTRAEASDVANAVLDGSDAVMLSGETAAGKYPVRTVEVMNLIIEETENHQDEWMLSYQEIPESLETEFHVTEAVGHLACDLAERVGAVAIACLTHTGTTARIIARYRPDVPIIACTNEPRVVAQLGVVWGVQALFIPFQKHTDAGVEIVHEQLKELGIAKSGDKIIFTAGMPLPQMGGTNMLHVSELK